jgi:hypothetical protein
MDLSKVGRRWQKNGSDHDWRQITRLAWVPAWRIRSRRGTLSLLLAWWRRRSRGTVPGRRQKPET